jgi:hypothetical protein
MATNLIEYATETYLNSPDREILTPSGCQTLFNVGEKALRKWRARETPIPHFGEDINSIRYPRAEVLKWFAAESLKPKEPTRD